MLNNRLNFGLGSDGVMINMGSNMDGGNSGSRNHTVFLDPGHGGSERGASSVRLVTHYTFGIFPHTFLAPFNESDLNLDVALRVRDILESEGIIVYMSRTTDVLVDNIDRAIMANESGADLFVSIHHNSVNPLNSGTMILYPLLEHHSERSVISSRVAENINNLVSLNTGLINLGVRESNLVVLNQTNMPAVLTEIGYMGGDYSFLNNPNNLQIVAENIATGILLSLRESP